MAVTQGLSEMERTVKNGLLRMGAPWDADARVLAAAAGSSIRNRQRDLVVMTGSLATAAGPISWSIEFDKESKLPVALK